MYLVTQSQTTSTLESSLCFKPGIIYTLSLGSLVWCCLACSRDCVIAPSNSISWTSPVNLILLLLNSNNCNFYIIGSWLLLTFIFLLLSTKLKISLKINIISSISFYHSLNLWDCFVALWKGAWESLVAAKTQSWIWKSCQLYVVLYKALTIEFG